MSRPTEAPPAERPTPATRREGRGAGAGEPRNYVGIVRAVVLVVLAAVALTTPGFLSQPSTLSLLTTVSFIGCVAVGMTLITISGNIMSFALGALVGATAMIFVLAVNWGGFAFGLIAALAFAGLSNALRFPDRLVARQSHYRQHCRVGVDLWGRGSLCRPRHHLCGGGN